MISFYPYRNIVLIDSGFRGYVVVVVEPSLKLKHLVIILIDILENYLQRLAAVLLIRGTCYAVICGGFEGCWIPGRR